jgi:LPXTG-motif cell wall-anchored protein
MTVIDQTTPSASGTSYYYLGATQQAPTLTATGQPSDTNWIQGDSGLLTDVANPIIPTYEVVETTAADQNLTQMTAKSVTVQDGNSVETVTYNFIQGQVGEMPATTTLTIIPVDSTGQALQDPSVQSGSQNTDFAVTAPEIAGYRLVDPQQALVTGTYHGNVMMLTLMYEPKPIEEVASNVTLTINYVDRLGNSIAPVATQSGNQGEPFSIAVPTIAGYRPVDPQQSEVTGTYHGNVMTLILTYEAQPTETVPTTVQLTVIYVDQNGRSVATPTHESGAQGTAFTITAPVITDYQLVDPNQQTVTGTYQGNQMTLTLTYRPEQTTPAGTPPTEADNSIVNETETDSPMIEVPVTPTPIDSGSSKSSSLEPTVASAPEKTIKNTPMVGWTATQPTSGKQQLVNQQRTLPVQSGTVSATNQPMTLPSDVNSVIETKLPQTSERATTKVTLIGVSLLAMLAGLGWQLKLRRKHER